MARSDVRLMHVYVGAVHEHRGADRRGLADEIEDYWAGHAHPMAYFDAGEFRDEARQVMLMVVEGC